MAIDLAALLTPVSDETPSGESVEYDPQFNELETAARGTPEREVGNTIIPAEEPNWREAEGIALELAGRSKDLRVAIYLARAALKLEGLAGFATALELIRGYVATFWPTVHPQLDPEDDNDPSARINTLLSLCDSELVLPQLRQTPLTQSRQFGRVSYRDIAIANGLMQPPAPKPGADKVTYPSTATIEAAFSDTPPEVLQATQEAAAAALAALTGIDEAVSEALGSGSGPDLDPLRRLLRDIKNVLDEQAGKRGVGAAPAAEAAGEEAGMAADGGGGAAPSSAAPATSGVIRDRTDVVQLLDKICRYYADREPSSPVPLMLERAKRLATMSFMEIVQDLTPEGVQAVGHIAGIKEEQPTE